MPLGMTALEIVLFATPRIFLFVAGPVRIQKLRTKPKVSEKYPSLTLTVRRDPVQVVSTIYPKSVKQKLLVNALLALCPVMLWIAHSVAGTPALAQRRSSSALVSSAAR
jgi:hypothetical protein